MEKKQLNFNAPLLSVRRFSSTVASSDGDNGKIIENLLPNRWNSLPLYKSDSELGEVTKPAAIPFMWEQIPGRPKGGSDAQLQSPEEPSNTPRLPPGRVLDVVKQLSEDASEVQNVFRTLIEAPSSNDLATLLESSNKGINVEGDSDLESGDDAYSDAIDTLSPKESFSLNCSLSGLSGYDGPDVKPSGTFSTDPQIRDFMMSRFLPAAKAMVVEMPQYVSRKQPVATEQPRQVKQVVGGERRPLLEQCRSNIMPHYGQYTEDVESEDEDEEYDGSGNKLAKACGIFPRFCLKNSLCLLNPVPGMTVRTRAPMSSASEVSRMTRTAYSGPQSQTVDKHAWDAVYKKTHNSAVQSHELFEVEKKLIGESNRSTYSSDLHMIDGSSPHRHSRGGGISPYRNLMPQSPFQKGAGFLGVPKVVENVKPKSFNLCNKGWNNFQDVSSHQSYKEGSGSVSPTVEKMLYIDSVNIVESISSEAKGHMDSSGEDFETLVESRGMEETTKVESSVQDIRGQNILEEGRILKPKASGSTKADLSSSSHTSDLKCQADRMEGLRLDRSLNLGPRSLRCSKVHTNGNLDLKNESLKADDLKNSNVGSLQSPLPPPLPKSPSESWLWRALPSISPQNSFSHSHSHSHFSTQFHPKKQGPKTSSTGTKWETIVKTSNLHYDNVRYSEELIPHVSQHSKT